MAHFAYLKNGVVQTVHVVNNAVITDSDGVEQEALGQAFLAGLHGYSPEDVVQCSYSGSMRGSFPGKGWSYDAELDEFVPPVVEVTEG